MSQSLALMPHPTQCEMKGSGSEWMGMLERFMGTTSARAAGGSPLTMLWLLLWTINRCQFLFSSLPLSFSLTPLPLRLVSPREMTAVLPYEFGKHTMRHERRQSWCPGCQSLYRQEPDHTNWDVWGRECIQNLSPRSVTANVGRRMKTFSGNQTVFSSNTAIFDR